MKWLPKKTHPPLLSRCHLYCDVKHLHNLLLRMVLQAFFSTCYQPAFSRQEQVLLGQDQKVHSLTPFSLLLISNAFASSLNLARISIGFLHQTWSILPWAFSFSRKFEHLVVLFLSSDLWQVETHMLLQTPYSSPYSKALGLLWSKIPQSSAS